ncbi:MAG: protoglobin domain-containing protein [Deltaproteobacteria bacterium]|nr:protoglobin domain-containing protein [Deltaproteobacteria bacterium]
MDRLAAILQKNGMSNRGAFELNGLFSQNNRDLLFNLVNFTPKDANNISKISPCMKKGAQDMANSFYDHLLLIEDTKKIILSKPGLLERLKMTQAEYIISLFSLNYDENYFKSRIAIGLIHNAYNVSPTIYIGSYGYYYHLISQSILKCCEKTGINFADVLSIVNSVQKIIIMDITLAIESYYKKSMDDTYKINHESLQTLFTIAEFRDEDTGRHILRMSNFAKIIAAEAGMDALYQEEVLNASPMHDIGKVGIPDSILLKPGKLTKDEFEIMKSHCEIGYDILKNSSSPILRNGSIIALSHHENFNGTGYPKGLKGEEIPLNGRITKIADVFDALVNKRVYKPAFTIDEAIRIMKDEMKPGEVFDPDCFSAFLKGLDEIITTKNMIDATQ